MPNKQIPPTDMPIAGSLNASVLARVIIPNGTLSSGNIIIHTNK